MVKLSEIKLLPHLPNEHLTGSSRSGRKVGKRRTEHVVRLSLLEERTARHQMTVNSKLREVYTHRGSRSIYRHQIYFYTLYQNFMAVPQTYFGKLLPNLLAKGSQV